VLISR